ncbi:hypothetical protein [Martelella sp. HB161492]|uniref:hypothetical protein n=1 Tax=Martelella sp. HB161492 TaxID=2720726 RepID=UPI001592257D|nr:hypothetical protein [Martelella sp. HB161492]
MDIANISPPRRRFSGTIRIEANSREALCSLLLEIANGLHRKEGFPLQAVIDQPDCSAGLDISDDPRLNAWIYSRHLEAYHAAIAAAGGLA